jgi:hypothetical protein
VGGNSMRWFGAIGASFVIALALGLYLKDQIAFARIATAYVAKQTCSCLHVGGRSLENCRKDYQPQDIAQIAITSAGQDVQASALGGAISSTAHNTPGFGCKL